MKQYIIALVQRITSSRALVFEHNVQLIAQSQKTFQQGYPQTGWVEHDPMEIWSSQSSVLTEVIARAGIHSDQVAAIGNLMLEAQLLV